MWTFQETTPTYERLAAKEYIIYYNGVWAGRLYLNEEDVKKVIASLNVARLEVQTL